MERVAERAATVAMVQPTAVLDVYRTVMQQLNVGNLLQLQARHVPSTSVAASLDFWMSENCVLNPKPPLGAASQKVLDNKVIGYYESWSARKECHKVSPTDLPLDALTHLNFAFAYINPDSYEIVTMDRETPASLFKDTANVKSIKEDISIYISVGGWTFSDNGTATQPLYGEIAADPSKRKKFANNVVHFLKQYGFDGLDIDWEYPGAGDRGGKPEDTANFVLLMKTLRETFDASGNKFGLTFTAPSSYWYLQWFDLPGLLKYADWINLMSYDLHGVWDADNPIGSIVQAHTNLTEIKLATELFWRAEVPPQKLVMGFGFYGRSFTLADKSCTKPGCPFKGASDPGPCSKTGGILGYYEIMEILKPSPKRSTLSPVHDKSAAVNYLTFNDDQWISYDDKTTFAQKIDWADNDDQYSAHSGLTGKTITSNPTLKAIDKALSNPKSVVEDLSSFNGQKCFKYEGHCVKLDDNDAMADACGSGYTVVGWDDAGCGKKSCHCGKPICCPTNSAPKNCNWRGDHTGDSGVGSDCSAQCAAGEINIAGITSSWGGGFTNDGDTNKCGRGKKAFCCPDPEWEEVSDGCAYAKCGSDCPAGTKELFSKRDNCWTRSQKYCCPDPDLTDCHWVSGSSGRDCANAKCADTEVAIDRASYGDSYSSCEWSRKKVACCTVSKAPPKPAICGAPLCEMLESYCSVDGDDEGSVQRRSVDIGASDEEERTSSLSMLEKRSRTRQVIKYFIECTINGLLQSGAVPQFVDSTGVSRVLPPIPMWFWESLWHASNAALGARPAIGGPDGATYDTPNDRVMGAFGTTWYPSPLLATHELINRPKGKMVGLKNMFAVKEFEKTVKNALKEDTDTAASGVLSLIQSGFAVFEYNAESHVHLKRNEVLQQVALQLKYIEEDLGIDNLETWWWLWAADFFQVASGAAQGNLIDVIRAAARMYIAANNQQKLKTFDSVISALSSWESKIQNLPQLPPPPAQRTIGS
ncbi:hypothetical protein BDW75DRAFT_246074 [Aspergillus navahoensis]